MFLNNRISAYIQANGDSSETIKKMCKRLCCAKKHVQNNKTSNMCDDDLPF